MSIYINPKTNFSIIKKNETRILIMHSKHYYIKYILDYKTITHYNRSCHSLTLANLFNTQLVNSVFKDFSLNTLKTLNYELTNYVVKKVKFLGKSYKIKKCSNYFSFEFNKAHIEVVVWCGFFLKKLKKATILIKGVNNNAVTDLSKEIINVRKINPFTLRGLRLSKALIKKKQGKKTN